MISKAFQNIVTQMADVFQRNSVLWIRMAWFWQITAVNRQVIL